AAHNGTHGCPVFAVDQHPAVAGAVGLEFAWRHGFLLSTVPLRRRFQRLAFEPGRIALRAAIPRCFFATRSALAFAATSAFVFSRCASASTGCRLLSRCSPPRARGTRWSKS